MKAKKTALLLLLYGLVLLLPAGLAPLVESTEARYGEIAREMLVSGNFIEPTFNGIKHFHKPPLAYWAMATGMRLFGQNDFGVRFFGVVAAVIAVGFTFRLALVIFAEERQALHAALIFATSLLMLVVARVASTDIYLTACTIAAQFYLLRQVYGERHWRNAVFYGLWLGLGFLTKGPVIFLFTLLPFLVAKLFDEKHRRVFSLKEVAMATLVFFAVALPWYLLAMERNPGLLGYFLGTQTVDRVMTNRFHRYQPPWYFLVVLAGTFLPYTLFLLKGVRHVPDLKKTVRILMVYVGVPLLVFSLAVSKLSTYILPFYGIASLFVAATYNRFAMPRLRTLSLVFLGLLGITPAVFALVVKQLNPIWQMTLLASLLPTGIVWWMAFRERRSERFLAWVAASLLLFGTTGYAAAGEAAHVKRGFERLVARINSAYPDRALPVVVYKDFLPSISFYRGHLAVMALGSSRDTQFQTNQEYRDVYLSDAAEVDLYLQQHPDLLLVTREKNFQEFVDRSGFLCTKLEGPSVKQISAYRCRAPALQPRAEKELSDSSGSNAE